MSDALRVALPYASWSFLVLALVLVLYLPRCHRCRRRWAWHGEEVPLNGRPSPAVRVTTPGLEDVQLVSVRDRLVMPAVTSSIVLPLCRRCAARR